ncbi:hypothetical protein LCGC14_1251010 [marine sediment metagenome]|uniref:Uncharacterized protein n=1 Tax=marine sediment metagenome TaxID=412755 RepID=A0A0F9L6T2_9ZZZZ
MTKIKKVSDTELEITKDTEKYTLTKEHIEKRLARFKTIVKEYESMLARFEEG